MMKPKPENHNGKRLEPSRTGMKIANVMLVLGAASVVSVLISIVRLKFIALLLGPAGIGLYGIFLSLQNAGVALFGLGFNSSGIRIVSQAENSPEKLTDIRWALVIGSLLLGLVACCVVWSLAAEISEVVFSDAMHATEIRWLGVGIVVSLLAGSQLAVLQGLRKIQSVAIYRVLGALIATSIGIGVIYQYGLDGVIILILLVPFVNIAVIWILVRRQLAPLGGLKPTKMPTVWKDAYALGLTFMGTASINAFSLIAIQTIIVRHGGPAEMGLFQAVFTLSAHYLGFLLIAAQADYYPKLAAACDQPRRVWFLVNKQTQIGFYIAAPIIILMASMSDWILPLLYSPSFSQAANLQRIWLLGDVLAIPTIYCAYVLLGWNKGSLFFFIKLLGAALYIVLVYAFYRSGFGLTGVAFGKVLMEMFVLVVTTIIVSRVSGFRWYHNNVAFGFALVVSLAIINGLALISPLAAHSGGLLLALGFGCIALLRIVGKEKLLRVVSSLK